jgi:hypothetical protein
MKLHRGRSWVLAYECLGALLIIAFCWLREMTGLASVLMGAAPRAGDWRNAAVGTVLILLAWAVVFIFTYRLVKQLVYLEKFIRVCAWCRKVCYREKWKPLEEYFESAHHVGTTHGICPECFQKAKDDTTRFFKRAMANDRANANLPETSGQTPGPAT